MQPSTSKNNGEFISTQEINRIINDKNENEFLILDCRSNGESIKSATRVRLPNVLLRRLFAGSLALSIVSPRLQDPSNCGEIVVICGENEADELISNALVKSLRANSYRFSIFNGSVDVMLGEFPDMRAEELSKNEKVLANLPPVGFLNIGSLRLESDNSTKNRAEFPVEISPYLYLGNAETARNRELLKRNNICYVINVTSNLPNAFEDDPEMRYLRISVDDNSSHNLVKFFQEAFSFIKEAQENQCGCLVHCLAGISRSVTICLAFLMNTRRVSLDIAYDWLQNKNASIAPNFHFMGQLTDYEKMLGLRSSCVGTYPSSAPRSPSCAIEAAASAGLLTPPPTSCSASPQSSTHSAKSFH